jgi:hypothetical protein
MVLLQKAIWTSPFFILAILLLLAGFVSTLHNLFRPVRPGNRKFGKAGEQYKENRIPTWVYIIILIVIVLGVIFFINWLSKIKYD